MQATLTIAGYEPITVDLTAKVATLEDVLDDNPIKIELMAARNGESRLIDCPADSECGRLIANLVDKASSFIVGAHLEHHNVERIIAAVVDQCGTIYWG